MRNTIPLHSLILVIPGNDESLRMFETYEILTIESISIDLVGQPERQDLSRIVETELKHRILLKLSLGERVVISSKKLLNRDFRLSLCRLALEQGASIIYIANKQNDRNIRSGDHIATVITEENPEIAKSNTSFEHLYGKFRGITIIGDIHGNLKMMKEALSWAKSRNHFVWLLGDVIDYGHDSLETTTLAYELVMEGKAAMILGNHERKIARWITQKESGEVRIKLSEGNRITTNSLMLLSNTQRNQWTGKFRSLLGKASIMSHIANVTLTHGAIHPLVWEKNYNDPHIIEEYALYGEKNQNSPEFRLSYNWIDAVPFGKTVFVGHDTRSILAPINVKGAKGGNVIFLDTGSGKGGCLSTADLRFVESTLKLECFNRY